MDYATSSAASSVTTRSDYCQVTYLITFTHLSLPTYLGEDFFTVVGIPPTDTVTVSVTFDPNLSFLYPENYSGPEYVYEEYYTPWSNLVLSFGDVSFSAFPTDGNPYTSIRVRDGISDGSEDIGDAVILDAELTTLTDSVAQIG